MQRQNRAVKVLRIRRVFDDPKKQAAFDQALATTGHWAKCRDCGQPRYVIPGYLDECRECNHASGGEGS